ncbi:hypothetical protein SPHINGOR109_20028 [Sphingorhabdus sp. 109]|nr:hypothetical protein SPHINGOR109_20028 [Sphingorhabdus sp. 109]
MSGRSGPAGCSHLGGVGQTRFLLEFAESNSVCHVSNNICNWQKGRLPANFSLHREQGERKS